MVQSDTHSLTTTLYPVHCALGAKMAVFGGWNMPIQYSGIISEHLAVRNQAGLFDVSHMGQIEIRGSDAERLLDYLSTNNITRKNNHAVYTVWCNESGFAIDDLLVYRYDKERFMVVANAANREKDLVHLKKHAQHFNVLIQDFYQTRGILALQGPKSEQILAKLFPEVVNLKAMDLLEIDFEKTHLVIAKTGYTGAGGFELFVDNTVIKRLWDLLIASGQKEELIPVGLGARDTLRLEMGYALYGHELSDAIAPTESVSSWTVKWSKDFLGKAALLDLEASGRKRYQYRVVLKEPGIAREGYLVSKDNQVIGVVTSGTYCPSLQQAIAIVMVNCPLKSADEISIQIRSNHVAAVLNS